MYYHAFNKSWFEKHSSKIVWFLNNPFLGKWLRKKMRMHEGHGKIHRIEPNGFYTREGDTETFHVTTAPIYARQIYKLLKPVWYTMHFIDWLILDRQKLVPSFGFEVLTASPDGDPESSTLDGAVGYYNGAGETWSTLMGQSTGTSVFDSGASGAISYMRSRVTAGEWVSFWRGMTGFDLSSLSGDERIIAATIALKRETVTNTFTPSPDPQVCAFSVSLNSNTSVSASDLGAYGTVELTDRASNATWTGETVNTFVLNRAGLDHLNIGGVTNFGWRFPYYDVGLNDPTHPGSDSTCRFSIYFAEHATEPAPELSITYSLVSPTMFMS